MNTCVVERQPATKIPSVSASEAELRVERTDVSFQDVPGGKVQIRVSVHNVGTGRSRPTSMKLCSAPFGAFVPWTPLTALAVPALEPGESVELSTEVARPHPAPLGDFNTVPPKKLLTAVSSPDQSPPSPDTAGRELVDIFSLLQRSRSSRRSPDSTQAPLPPDLLELLGRKNRHWAGNICVFRGRQSVERHMARALRIYPGRTNMAVFDVGTPSKLDAYAFDLVGLGPEWEARLFDVTNNSTLVADPSEQPIHGARWVESHGRLMMVTLTIRPPADCQSGNLEVHVTQRSSGKTAIVEFNLDPNAQGPGCYHN